MGFSILNHPFWGSLMETSRNLSVIPACGGFVGEPADVFDAVSTHDLIGLGIPVACSGAVSPYTAQRPQIFFRSYWVLGFLQFRVNGHWLEGARKGAKWWIRMGKPWENHTDKNGTSLENMLDTVHLLSVSTKCTTWSKLKVSSMGSFLKVHVATRHTDNDSHTSQYRPALICTR